MMMQMQRQHSGFALLHTTHAAVIPISNPRELMGSGAQDDGSETKGYPDIYPSHGRASWCTIACGAALYARSAADTPPENAPGLLARCCWTERAFEGDLGVLRCGRSAARRRPWEPTGMDVCLRAAALSPCISAPVPASSRAPQSRSQLFLALSFFRTSLLRYGQWLSSRSEAQSSASGAR